MGKKRFCKNSYEQQDHNESLIKGLEISIRKIMRWFSLLVELPVNMTWPFTQYYLFNYKEGIGNHAYFIRHRTTPIKQESGVKPNILGIGTALEMISSRSSASLSLYASRTQSSISPFDSRRLCCNKWKQTPDCPFNSNKQSKLLTCLGRVNPRKSSPR